MGRARQLAIGLPDIGALKSTYGSSAALVTTRVDEMRFISAAALGDDLRVVSSVVARSGGAVLWRHAVQSRPRGGEAAVVHATLLAETALLGVAPAAAESLLQPLAIGGGDAAVAAFPASADEGWEGGAEDMEFVRSEMVFADDLDGFGRLSSVRYVPLCPARPPDRARMRPCSVAAWLRSAARSGSASAVCREGLLWSTEGAGPAPSRHNEL
jgi:hypothetical protein